MKHAIPFIVGRTALDNGSLCLRFIFDIRSKIKLKCCSAHQHPGEEWAWCCAGGVAYFSSPHFKLLIHIIKWTISHGSWLLFIIKLINSVFSGITDAFQMSQIRLGMVICLPMVIKCFYLLLLSDEHHPYMCLSHRLDQEKQAEGLETNPRKDAHWPGF